MTELSVDVTQDDIDKGDPRHPGFCPVALAISRVFPGGARLCTVGSRAVQITCGADHHYEYSLDPETENFVHLFDLCEGHVDFDSSPSYYQDELRVHREKVVKPFTAVLTRIL